jgi:hypothetical protein
MERRRGMKKTNEELGISRIPIPYAETINTLINLGQVDISSLDKQAKAYLSRVGNKTGAFEYVKVCLLRKKDKDLAILSRNTHYLRIKTIDKKPIQLL